MSSHGQRHGGRKADRRPRGAWAALAVAGAIGSLSGVARATDTTTEPYPGVTWLYRNTASQKINVLTIDLSLRTFRVRATKPPGGMGTDDFAVAYDCQLAINGDFGTWGDPWATTGLAMGDGELWATNDGTLEGFTAFGRDNTVVQSPPAEVLEAPEAWMSEIVGGRPLIVDEGVVLDTVPPYSREGCDPHFCALHPRTAAGIDQTGTKLILATIDGRYTGADGMTTKQVGTLMVEMGAWRALNMDGGGSTAMYIENQGGVVNNPSDGSVRTVANHLGIQIVEPYGDLTGYVRDTDVADATAGIGSATVSLSTGESTLTDPTGHYSFTHVSAGDLTLTAAAAGFHQGTLEVDVIATESTEANIALLPGSDEPDAGAGGSAGAGGAASGGSGGQAGGVPSNDDADGGCGCRAVGRDSTSGGSGALALLLAGALLLRTRRRAPEPPSLRGGNQGPAV